VDVVRTPEERFADLPDFPFAPHHTTISDGLRMHHVDEGPRDAAPVLMLTASRPGVTCTAG
jgi:haloalkane dehalogenase